MARIDLNIVDRGIQGTDWVAESIGLTAEQLDKVVEMKTDNCSALNSLPTPFARFFVANEAFRRVMQEYQNPNDNNKQSGFAYRQMVSDILDVYELLFNLKYHCNNSWKQGQKIVLREWDAAENLQYIQKKMPVLYNSLKEYYKTDIMEDKLYFVIFIENGKEYLLGCSSPITGFVTPPDMDKYVLRKGNSDGPIFADETRSKESKYKNLHIRRKSGGEYFRDVKLLGERDADFKNYMYHTLFGSDSVDNRLKAIKEYVQAFRNDTDIRNDYTQALIDVKTEQNDALIVNGLCIKSSDEIDLTSFFTSDIIRIPYRISRDCFKSVNYKNDDPARTYDYLLPFKPEVLSLFKGNFNPYIHIKRQSVSVSLEYNGKSYEKEYAVDPFKGDQGRIIDLATAKINFDMGVFPNILSKRAAENNYFKIFIVAADEDKSAPNFNIDKIHLGFYKKQGESYDKIRQIEQTDMAEYGVLPAFVRSRQKDDSEEGGTKFYELFGTSFDVIEITLLNSTGLLFPVWKESQLTNDSYTYAIDLGTSNTFISRKKDGENNTPDLFAMDEPMVNYMHEVPKDAQFSLTRQIESSVFKKAENKLKTEFLPAFIDGKEYKFPIRTAICGIKNSIVRPRLFDNYNIAFFYERFKPNVDQTIHTDIKWNQEEDMLRVFVRELLLIIKCDILQRNGDLSRTNLIWFRPLSFAGAVKSLFEDIWKGVPGGKIGEAEQILFVRPSQIKCYSESEAPYYFFKKMNIIPDSDAVSVIDIGGGSTDFVYFKDNSPQLANSVHFGCDVLWDNGFIDFENARENGIYKKYESVIRFEKKELTDLYELMKADKSVKTKDIINFWLSNATYCDIIKQLRSDYIPVFAYHFTSIIFYMANMYMEKNLMAPRTLVFSGNGSRYIDSFISNSKEDIKQIVDYIFDQVFGGKHDVHVELPQERKESTCYGGLYRASNAPHVPECVYHGDCTHSYDNVASLIENYSDLKDALMLKYKSFISVYQGVLGLLKKTNIMDPMADTSTYILKASENMGTPLDTYFKTQVKEKYQNEVSVNDSVFFLPIINQVFEMTKI